MTSGFGKTACAVICLALTGCASQDLLVKRQAEAEARIEHLLQADKKNTQRINELSDQLQTLEKQFREYDGQMQASLRELRGARNEAPLPGPKPVATKIEVVHQETASAGRESGPPSGYVKAFGLYSANDFGAAITAFQAFLDHSPTSEYAANAVYWIGECHYSLSDLPKALSSFQRVVESYPNSSKMPDALLKLGYTQAAMQQREAAAKTFQELIRRFPASPAAARARERLTAH